MNYKNKMILDKIQNELINNNEDKELKEKCGTVTLTYRYFKGTITKDADITFKETFKLED